MSQRAFVVPREHRTAPATLLRFERHDLLTFLNRNQRPFVSGMSGLPTTFSLRFYSNRRRACVRMLSAGWQRRVLRCPVLLSQFQLQSRDLSLQSNHLRSEFCHLGHQCPNDRLGFRRLTRDHILRNRFQRHLRGVANSSIQRKASFQPVNGYKTNTNRISVKTMATMVVVYGYRHPTKATQFLVVHPPCLSLLPDRIAIKYRPHKVIKRIYATGH